VSFQQHALVRLGTNRRVLASIVVFIIFALSFSFEINTWRKFDWSVFVANARYVSLLRAVVAVAFIHVGFLLRAVRWSVLLRPLKGVPATRLIGPTFVGFAGLALLGRAGELVRPYLISRKEGLNISSQLAALTVERIFDIVSASILILATILLSSKTQSLPHAEEFRRGALMLLALISVIAFVVFLLAKNGEKLSRVLQLMLSPLPAGLANRAAETAGAFSADLNMIRDAKSLAQIVVLSISIWLLVGLAYLETIHAFGNLWRMSLGDAFILMGFSLLGSLVQLPGGGTPQLIFIAALVQVFGVSAELAVSCGILGWLTIYMAPVPLGMALLRHEHSSLRALQRGSAHPSVA
jgi:glycosyltransferase 2 family protein